MPDGNSHFSRYLSARYNTIAADSGMMMSPSTSTGTLPAGLRCKKSGPLCSPANTLTGTNSKSTSSSLSAQSARNERVGPNPYSFIVDLLISLSGGVPLFEIAELRCQRALERWPRLATGEVDREIGALPYKFRVAQN